MATPDRKQVLRSAPTYDENPFIEEDGIVCMKTRKALAYREGKNEIYAKTTADEIGKCDGFYRRMEVDTEQFIKIYAKGIAAMANLHSPGRTVFQFLLTQMRHTVGKDRVPLSTAVAKTNEISQAVFLKGITELLNAGFIAKTPYPGLFWINPTYVFNGNRLRFITDYDLIENPIKDVTPLRSQGNDQ